MNNELPDHLKPTVELLSRSLAHHSSENAPEIPTELLEDLGSRFAKVSAPAAPAGDSWFHNIRSFLSMPAFGLAAAAAVVALVVVPTLTKPAASTGFRGTLSDVEAAASIVLISAPEGAMEALRISGNFEDGAIADGGKAPAGTTGPQVVVDFQSSTIRAIDPQGRTIFSSPIPESPADLPDAVAAALMHL